MIGSTRTEMTTRYRRPRFCSSSVVCALLVVTTFMNSVETEGTLVDFEICFAKPHEEVVIMRKDDSYNTFRSTLADVSGVVRFYGLAMGEWVVVKGLDSGSRGQERELTINPETKIWRCPPSGSNST